MVFVFHLGMALAGWLAVAGSSDRVVTTADGRTVDIGESWPGALDACVTDVEVDALPNCYREPVDRGSFVKQPWSTYSTLAFCVVGLVVLASADRTRRRDEAWLGFVALFMGPGSALFHGTLTRWGGWGDVLSMYALLAVIVAADVVRLRGRERELGWWWLGLFAIAPVLNALAGDLNTYVFIAMGVATGTFVLVAWLRLLPRIGVRRSGARLALAYFMLGAAIVPWVLSNPAVGDPTSVPYHAAWHVIAALFVAAYWSYPAVRDDEPGPTVRMSEWCAGGWSSWGSPRCCSGSRRHRRPRTWASWPPTRASGPCSTRHPTTFACRSRRSPKPRCR